MIGKPVLRATSSRASDMQSVTSMATVRTVDRERLRDKARQMQMNERLRLAMCARLQQKLRKTPKVAEEMASEVLRILKHRGLPTAGVSDAALAEIEVVATGQQQVDSAPPTNGRLSRERNSGRRSSNSKERSNNNKTRHAKGGRGNGITTSRTFADDDRYLTEANYSKRVAQRIKERKLRERREYTSKLEAQVSRKRHTTEQEREQCAEFHRQTLEKLRLAEDEEHGERTSDQESSGASGSRDAGEQRKDDLAREKARKDAEKRRVEKVFQENEAQLQQKRQHQAQERELELKLADEYIAMEKRKDEARRKQIETMAENIKKKMKIFDDTAKASTDAKAREEDERVQRYQQEYTKKLTEDERKRRADAEARSLAQAEYLTCRCRRRKSANKL
ncbi:hypothetical protein GQ600_7174 [Phytophthora cactorum]|nr:hypothetical protein GQ600_7174 [Phytophthora cactorum]